MKSLVVLLLVVLVMPGSALAQYEQTRNTMAVFFDPAGITNYQNLEFTGVPRQVTAYFLLINPTEPAVQSWEARIEADLDTTLDPGSWILEGGVNTAVEPDFRVDLGTAPFAAPSCEPLLLAHRDLLILLISAEHAEFNVMGIPGSTQFDGTPGYRNATGQAIAGELFYDGSVSNQSYVGLHSQSPTPWPLATIDDFQGYDELGGPTTCLLEETVIVRGRVLAGNGLVDESTYFLAGGEAGIQVIDPTPRNLVPGAWVEVDARLELRSGEVTARFVSDFFQASAHPVTFVPIEADLGEIATTYDHVGGFFQTTGEVLSTDAGGLDLGDGVSTLRIAIPASLGLDPAVFAPGRTVSVAGIFSIRGGRHLILRNAAELEEVNVATERRSLGGVKALFR